MNILNLNNPQDPIPPATLTVADEAKMPPKVNLRPVTSDFTQNNTSNTVAMSILNNPQDPTPLVTLSDSNEAKMPLKVSPYPVTTNDLGRPVFPQIYGFAGLAAAGPWSYHEHRLFEQGCIMYGWGNWKKIQEAIPCRTKDQCKSHGQKFLKHHPNEKDRLIMEHRKMLQQQKANKSRPVPKKVSAKKAVLPTQTNKALKKKVKVTFKKERLSEGGGGKKGNHCQKFSADSIDTICNEIYERKLKSGCKRFPLCICEKTPCAREGLTYQFHVGGQPLYSAAAAAFLEDIGSS